MDYIECVGDILEPEDSPPTFPSIQEDCITMDEHSDSSIIGEEMAESQTIPSSSSLQEVQGVARLKKTNDVKQIKGWKNKIHAPSLPRPPCQSPTTRIPPQSEISTPNVSKSPPDTVVSDTCDSPCTLMDDDEDFSIQQKVQEEIDNRIISGEEQAKIDNTKCANFDFPSLERTKQTAMKLEAMLKESTEMLKFSALRKQTNAKDKVETNVQTNSEANDDETELDELIDHFNQMITLTEPAPSLPGTLGVKSTEPTGVSSTEQPEDFVPSKEKDEISDGASSEQDKAVDATLSSKTPTEESELPEANAAAVASPIAPPPSEDKVQKPRKFIARVKGLPATLLAVFSNKVLVKHLLNPKQVMNFDSVDNAKVWLQSLATLLSDEVNWMNCIYTRQHTDYCRQLANGNFLINYIFHSF